MEKLEQEIWNAQMKVAYSSNPADHAHAAAEVAKKYIDKALGNYSSRLLEVWLMTNIIQPEDVKMCRMYTEDWLKENGIV